MSMLEDVGFLQLITESLRISRSAVTAPQMEGRRRWEVCVVIDAFGYKNGSEAQDLA